MEHMKNALYAESVVMARQQALLGYFFSSSDSQSHAHRLVTGIIFFVYCWVTPRIMNN